MQSFCSTHGIKAESLHFNGICVMVPLSDSSPSPLCLLADSTQLRPRTSSSPPAYLRSSRTSILRQSVAPDGAYCEMGTSGIWTVIQKRTGGAVAFDREWAAYKNGFGFVSCLDHWLGLKKISAMTKDKSKRWKLRVDLWDYEGCNESTNYRLSVGRYRGTAGTDGAYHGIDQNGLVFSTFDRDNDGCDPCIFFCDIAARSCTDFDQGGWRYNKCGSASLNGDWHPKGANTGWLSGLHWLTWKRPVSYSARATRMMFTPM
uniref:Fibrinogen C-terminal domain-containing protein n=1 Tax=Oryzias latipes TaxID=8090 RepID=A0A3P9LI82_ORYLA